MSRWYRGSLVGGELKVEVSTDKVCWVVVQDVPLLVHTVFTHYRKWHDPDRLNHVIVEVDETGKTWECNSQGRRIFKEPLRSADQLKL
jgi:hypothetical protein